VIPDTYDFYKAINVGLFHVENGKIVIFRIKPTNAVTGYGYLKLSVDSYDDNGTSNLKKFVEKSSL
jgi:mannose-1-phosphate guanylyltransferase